MAQHWDVSQELRGEHGKWSKGGSVIGRLTSEAGKAAEGKLQEGHRVKYKTGAMGTVHHVDEKGVPHVVWDKGRGKPVRTPAHHLTRAEGDQKQSAAAEKAAREVTAKPYKPPRQAGSRGGVPAPTTGPDLAHERFISEKLADGQWHDPATVSKDRARALATLQRMEASGKVESRTSPTTGTKQWRLKAEEKKSAGGLSPELRAQMEKIQAEQKAKMEAENKTRLPAGNVTERKDILTTPESAAYLAKLRGGGVQATRPFEDVHKEYQKALAARDRMTSGRFIPGPLAMQSNQREISRLESEMRGMGARRKNITGVIQPGTNMHQWEMPPKAGTPAHAAEKIKRDIASITEQLHEQHQEAGAPLYTPEQLVETRRSDMAAQVRAGQKTIVVKVPSGSEIQMSDTTAKYLLYGEQPGAPIERGTAQQAYLRSTQKRGVR